MARKLASIQLIESLTPIAAADELVLAQIMGWRVVVKTSFNMAPGDKVVYFEIDSLLPSDNPVFEFMAKCNYRVRTMKLRNVTSQGIVLPLALLGLNAEDYNVGDDVTEKLGVTKWVHPRELAHDRHMMAQMKTPEDKTAKEEKLLKQRCKNGAHGCLAFPVQYVDKTDEPRVQSNLHLMQAFQGKPYYATVKIDGTSGTFLISPDTDKFVACSRNLQRDDTPAPAKPTVKNGVVAARKRCVLELCSEIQAGGGVETQQEPGYPGRDIRPQDQRQQIERERAVVCCVQRERHAHQACVRLGGVTGILQGERVAHGATGGGGRCLQLHIGGVAGEIQRHISQHTTATRGTGVEAEMHGQH